jgi:glycosyltransferase involved in cell wall biosynthesis
MHVLLLPSWYPTTESPIGGVYFQEQARMLRDAGMTVGVVYPEHHSLRRLSPAAVWRNRFQTEWTSEPVPTLRRHGWNVWSRLRWGLQGRIETAVDLAEQYIERRGRPDVVHAHSAQWAAAAAARIQERTGIPYVVTEHFSGFREDRVFAWQWPLIREGLDNASGIACVSRSLRQDLVTQGLVDTTEVEIIPNPVDPMFFRSSHKDQSDASKFRLITVTRLVPHKQVDLLLRAVSRLPSTVVLTVVGNGPSRRSLEDLATALNIDDQVRFTGTLDREEVRAAYSSSDAFVLASRTEPFGVVLVEAMATGLPLVATRSGGPEDIVTPNTGILVPTDDPEALAAAVKTLRDAPADRFRPETIRAVAVDRYSPDTFVQRSRSLYEDARLDRSARPFPLRP